MFWGVTPAIDLQEECLRHGDKDAFELNFLVIGGCDARHVIKTLAQAHRHQSHHLNFYLVDGCPALVARQMLLLNLALERTTRVGLLEKTRRFIEIFGNTLLRPSTSRYLIAKSNKLVDMITNPKILKQIHPYMSIDDIKYTERDYMEMLLGFWSTSNTNQFNVVKLWDKKLRATLGLRYDTRSGVYDWDYYMRLKDIAGRICHQEYKHFREHGVAFTWLESEVCRPNTSLAAVVCKYGDRYVHRGYLGDMVTSPYVAYGLDCEDKDMLKSEHGQNYKRCTDITERNVMRMFYELENRTTFDVESMSLDTRQNLGLVVLANIDAKISECGPEAPLLLREDRNWYIDLDWAKINILSLSNLEHYPNKEQFREFFHGIYVSQNMISRVKPNVWSMVRDNALVMMESKKYVIQLKRDEVKAFGDQIKEVAAAAPCETIGTFDPEKDDMAKFLIKRNGVISPHTE